MVKKRLMKPQMWRRTRTSQPYDPDCQKSYTTKWSLEEHVSSYHENQRFQCEYSDCRKFYSTRSNLTKHVSKAHKNKRFDTIAVLKAHLADIDSQIETVSALISGFNSFECDDCFLNKWCCQTHVYFAIWLISFLIRIRNLTHFQSLFPIFRGLTEVS